MSRIAIIKKEKCFPDKCQSWCGKMCPRNRLGEKCIIINKKAFIDEGLCIGCGICEKCPVNAISIINLPETLKEAPIHRFLPNGFALYKLSLPKQNAVTGILGRNGIGKTTTINILANILKPNGVIKLKEVQAYFEKNKKISYKPQRVDNIPEFYKGKVIDLLKKVDETNKLYQVIEELELKNILENNINELSGGELQRVAIASTSLKKADIYFFDEPSSYLDIKQRLNISKFIHSLANENISVVIIEHDLMILDYISDFVYFMYGKSGCYGISSLLKTTKAGINNYLEGYTKEENIRFRDKNIKFEIMAKEKLKLNKILTTWDNFKQTLGRFTLEAESGEIKAGEIIGILGPNGIGKTTFIKAIADKLKLNISYKPQYLTSSKDYVKDILKNARTILKPLELEHLLDRKLDELSGGELQRVAIALCLSKEADIYLLDEPSAYLDVEQRLALTKLIENIVRLKERAVIVVDHDLLFLDYLSNRLIVFEGDPGIHGKSTKPLDMETGMNKLLKEMNITVRRDEESGRPRINKLDSVKDKEQKAKGKYYYS